MDGFQWVGFTVSLVTTMFCGIVLSFNVYAVKLKTSFSLDQWQVELLASSLLMGLSFTIVTAWIIKRFGYQTCYIVVLLLTTSSSLLMWLSTQYVPFFRERIWMMCLFQFFITAGTGGGYQCISTITVRLVSPKHTGKIIGLYMAALGLGNIYYAVIFETYFQQIETLGPFFLSLTICLAVGFVLCYFLHRTPADVDCVSNNTSLVAALITNTAQDADLTRTGHKEETVLQTLFTSWYFYLMGACLVIFQTSVLTFSNNVTGIAVSVGSQNPFALVYIISIVVVVSRIGFGVLYDYFESLLVGTFCLLLIYVLYFISMLIGLFWLDEQTIYVMVVLAGIGCGAGVTIPYFMMTTKFSTHSYAPTVGILFVCLAPAILLVHIGAGLTYDNAVHLRGTTDLFCKECFKGTFLIMLGSTIFLFFLQILNTVISITEQRRLERTEMP